MEQSEIMSKLLNEYNFKDSWFFHRSNESLEDMEYDDVINMLIGKKTK